MKTKTTFILSIIFCCCSAIYSQGFKPPAEGKAVVYIVRTKSYGYKMEMRIFNNNKFIAEFKGENYFRYECDPGHQLFWTISENHEYMEADLTAGKTYIIQAGATTGAFKARVYLTPVSTKDQERFNATRSVILKMAPFVEPEEELTKLNSKLTKMINENLKDFDTKKKSDTKFSTLSSDMAIPEDLMK
jgi:hypothetical protein